MSPEESRSPLSSEEIEAQVRQAVEHGARIRDEVAALTREALSGGRLDRKRVEETVRAVGRGAAEGAGAHPGRAREAVSESMEGLESALSQSAQSARLALQEAAGKVGAYSEQELKQVFEDLASLERLMLDSLQRAAGEATNTGGEVLRDLVRHARNSGTTFGREMDKSLSELATALPKALGEAAQAGIGAARETGARAAEAASGMLEGLAESLRSTGKEAAADDDEDASGKDPST